MEDEWDFIIPNKADRLRFLGLDFMIQPDDENTDVTIPIKEEIQTKKNKEVEFSEEQYEKLISNSSPEILKVHEELDNYIMSLDSTIKRGTTSVYLSYTTTKNFIEEWFQSNSLKYIIMTGEYNDPEHRVVKLAESYKWTNDNSLIVNVDDDLEYVKNILRQSYEKELNKNKSN
jgi:predicted transport protein